MGFDQMGKVVAFYLIVWGAIIFGAGWLLHGCMGGN
jgi:hypothetical protein